MHASAREHRAGCPNTTCHNNRRWRAHSRHSRLRLRLTGRGAPFLPAALGPLPTPYAGHGGAWARDACMQRRPGHLCPPSLLAPNPPLPRRLDEPPLAVPSSCCPLRSATHTHIHTHSYPTHSPCPYTTPAPYSTQPHTLTPARAPARAATLSPATETSNPPITHAPGPAPPAPRLPTGARPVSLFLPVSSHNATPTRTAPIQSTFPFGHLASCPRPVSSPATSPTMPRQPAPL